MGVYIWDSSLLGRQTAKLFTSKIHTCVNPREINLTLVGLKREGDGSQIAYIGTEEAWPWEAGTIIES